VNLLEKAKALATRAAEAGGSLRLPADDVRDLARSAGGPVDRLLLELIPLARELALPRLSGFAVGAVALGSSGALYLGANCEPDDSSVAHTIHAEQSAVASAVLHGEAGVERLAVSAPPCGYCRQFLYELSTADRLQVLLAGRPPIRLTGLLPEAFGPRDLGVQGGLPSATPSRLEWIAPTSGPAAEAALSAARRSYAPYTGAVAGIGLVARCGQGRTITVGGMYLENAAFNPSLSPLQTALVALTTAACPIDGIVEAALVQLPDSRVWHADAASALLAHLAPGAHLHTHLVRRV
jgi:cytidine deaminase